MDINDYEWDQLVELLQSKRVRIMLKADGCPLTHCAQVVLHKDNPGYVAYGFFMTHDGSSVALDSKKENVLPLNYVNTVPTDLMYALGAVMRRISMFKSGSIKFSTLLLNSGGFTCTYSVDNLQADGDKTND